MNELVQTPPNAVSRKRKRKIPTRFTFTADHHVNDDYSDVSGYSDDISDSGDSIVSDFVPESNYESDYESDDGFIVSDGHLSEGEGMSEIDLKSVLSIDAIDMMSGGSDDSDSDFSYMSDGSDTIVLIPNTIKPPLLKRS